MSKNLPEDLPFDRYSVPIISALKLKRKTKDEYGGPCPICKGDDRFWINSHQGQLRFHCRKCDDFKPIKEALRDLDLLPRWSPKNQPKISASIEPYHVRKGIDLNLGKCSLDGDKLTVQIDHIITGKKRGTQTITNGSKLFSKGLVKEGAGSLIGP
ncbi:hypothetical protein N9C56_13840, partial [Paracoccaceae bacterium]|nr:hypothetical protein [Paracoccaceae bacterium]